MPITISRIYTKKRILLISLSKDWNTRTPWTHKGSPAPYFSVYRNVGESKRVHFTYVYIGPISVLYAKWVG